MVKFELRRAMSADICKGLTVFKIIIVFYSVGQSVFTKLEISIIAFDFLYLFVIYQA